MNRLAVLIVGIAVFVTAHAFAADIGDIMPSLKAAKQVIDSTLAEIDTDLKAAAKALSNTDLKADAARKILNDLRKYRPYVMDCSIIDADGVEITVEPAEYKQYEGANRSDLPHVMLLLKNKKPIMSSVYHSAEDIHVVTIGYPIFSDKGEFSGAVRMLIRHELFLRPLLEDKPCKIWVMQKDGLVVYDVDPEEIGKNIFSDPIFSLFEDLISFSKTVASSKSGAGSYSFYIDGLKDKRLAEKTAVWDTAGLYGTEWRVVAMEIDRLLGQPAAATAAETAPASARQAPAK
ncbi:MAG: cache domain-containing protein [Candidatus Omnitrophica bacterium]|nr:cache domain-containing protein [Candidatus Omnitrophota bacterium]